MESIALILAGLFSAGLGMTVVVGQPRRAVSWYFFGTTLSTALWSIGVGLFLYFEDTSLLFYSAQMYYMAAAAIAPFTLLTLRAIGSERRFNQTDLLYSFPAIMMLVMLLIYPQGLITSVETSGNNTAELDNGLYAIYCVYFASYYLLALAFIGVRYMNERVKRVRRQYALVLHAFGWAGAVGVIFNLLLPAFGNYNLIWIGPLGLFLFVPIVYFAIAKHQLFDLKGALVRTVVYLFALTTLSLVYFALAYLASATLLKDSVTTGLSVSPVNIFLALVLAFIFQPVRQFFDKTTDRIFYRNRYDVDEFIGHFGDTLISSTDINEMLERASEDLEAILKASFAAFVVYHSDADNDVISKGRHPDILKAVESDIRGIVRSFGHQDVIVVEDLYDQFPQYKTTIRRLLSQKVALILPLTQSVGFLALGEQRGSGYSHRDIKVLRTISNELIIAIQNARSVQEVSELNAHLKQRINDATRELRASNSTLLKLDETKDEFISMASHQLRTPLTSVKGYVSMVLEGDAGKITPAQKKLLEEAYASSERMVHLIGDFLNVSRIQTGKFMLERHEADLSEMIRQEVEGMKQIADSHQVKLTYRKPKVFPIMYLDDSKLRQVVMNFIDNAIYYSPDNTPVTVSASVEDGSAVVRITDKGMGVPLAAQKKLFTKFFRAENARTQRPDGTGVGLFLAKKVIDEHGGTILFESTEDKGSTFGFRLPIKKLSEPPEPVEGQ